MADPIRTFERLRELLFRYYGTPFRLADPDIERERLELLDNDDGVWREPWVEAIGDYALTGQGFQAAMAELGMSADFVEFAKCGLVAGYDDVFVHQRDALQHAAVGRNVAI